MSLTMQRTAAVLAAIPPQTQSKKDTLSTYYYPLPQQWPPTSNVSMVQQQPPQKQEHVHQRDTPCAVVRISV